MKTTTLTVFLLSLFISTSAYSQEKLRLELGLLLSIGTSTYKYTGEVEKIKNDFSSKLDFQIGAYSRIKFRRAFLQPEIFWARKGMKGLYVIGRSSERVTLHSDYIASTALFGLELDKLSIAAGPELGFNFRNTVDGERVENLFETKLDASLNFSVGFRIKKYLRVSGRYNHGLEKLWKVNFVDALGNLVTEADIKQHAYFVTLSYNLWK